ncbi:MAG: hypothetical protein VYE68_07875 [Acidobacteriota bacterium]|nr:hypothetical protein [Acidobacteriota bacterium]
MNRVRLWAILFLLVVFGAGLAAGFAIRPWVDPFPAEVFTGRGPRGGPPPTRMTERLLDRIAADIDLSDDQHGQLRALFDRSRLRFREMSVEVRERFETERAQMNGEIANILTPVQLEIFEREIIRMRRARRGPRGREGHPRDVPRRFPREPR